jgi:polysaccharide deacetylase 2 family uncharacterized protein YibQ
MRLLFYTATAVFLVLAGVFAFYALQSSDQAGSARVVLSIDANERPAGEGEAGRLQADVKDVLARAESQLGENGGSGARPDTADRLPQGDTQIEAAAPPSGLTAEDRNEQAPQDGPPANEAVASDLTPSPNDEPATEQPQEKAELDSGALPGTMLAGVDDKDLFPQPDQTEPQAPEQRERSTSADPEPQPTEQQVASLRGSTSAQELAQPEREAPAAGGSLQAATPEPATPPAGSAPAEAGNGVPPRNEEEERRLRANFDAFLAAHNNERQDKVEPESRVAVVPPPFPPRRPETIPASPADASGSWAGRQVAAKEDKPRKGAKGKEVRVAILLRGVGRDDRNSGEAVTKLPPAISLGFMPFIGASQEWARKARDAGHEVIVQLPLEPSDYPINNPGAETLLTSSNGDENLSRIGTILGRFENYTGVSNYLGGKLLQSEAALRPIVQGLKTRGLIYVGEGNNSHGLLRKLAGEVGLRYGGADMMIDAHPAPEEIRKSLERLAELARKDGSAIGMGYASKNTIEQLQVWSQTLAQQGITLVPVGALAQTPGAS